MPNTVIEATRRLTIQDLKTAGLLRYERKGNLRWYDQEGKTTAMMSLYIDPDPDEGFTLLGFRYETGDGRGPPQTQIVRLTSTPCYFGGFRHWFLCPNESCGRRIGTLVIKGQEFGCRTCFRLSYRSRNENRRSANHALYRAMLAHKVLYEAEDSNARFSYAGKLTKKARRIKKRLAQANISLAHYRKH